MAPILVDRNRLLKIALLLASGMIGLFLSGYFIGFHKAEVFSQRDTLTMTAVLPPARVQPFEAAHFVPHVIEPGADRDVDAPDTPTVQQPAEAENREVMLAQSAAQQAVSVAAADQKVAEIATAAAPGIAIGGPLQSEEDKLALLADTAEETLAHYTIQVGLFSSADNAERKVEDLLAQRLNAYSMEYTGKQQRLMYNVRFGYYRHYSDARTALQIYKDVLAGDGYIVKLKR